MTQGNSEPRIRRSLFDDPIYILVSGGPAEVFEFGPSDMPEKLGGHDGDQTEYEGPTNLGRRRP